MAKSTNDAREGGSNQDGTNPVGDNVNEAAEEDDIAGLNNEERQEYEFLNQTLDRINTCLDDLEKRNDSLNAQFRKLLELSQAARNEMQQACDQNEEQSMDE